MGVEPTKDRLTAPPGFEVRTPHQGRFSSIAWDAGSAATATTGEIAGCCRVAASSASFQIYGVPDSGVNCMDACNEDRRGETAEIKRDPDSRRACPVLYRSDLTASRYHPVGIDRVNDA